MEGWTVKEGYPVITVSDLTDSTAKLTQKRFFLNSAANASDFKWYVPISMTTPGSISQSTEPVQWIRDDQDSITIDITSRPFLINVKQTGYYRVNYDLDTWSQLTNILLSETDMTQIDRLNRAQIIDDSFSLARSGQLDYEVALKISESLLYEKDYIPLKAALNKLIYLDLMFRDMGADYTPMQDYIKLLLADTYDSYGFTAAGDEVYFDALIREELIQWMCAYEYDTCLLYTSPSPRD